MIKLILNTLTVAFDFIKLRITAYAKHTSHTVTKTRTRLARYCSSRLFLNMSWHSILLGSLLSYGIIAPIYAALSTAEPLPFIECPNKYAYEDSPGVYIRCEDWDEFVKLYESKKDYKHLTLVRGK